MHKAAVTALTVVPASTQHVGSKQSHATSASRSPSSSPIPSGTERIMAGFVGGVVMLLDLRRRDAPRAISIPESKRLIVMRCNTTTNPLSIWRVSNSSITGTSQHCGYSSPRVSQVAYCARMCRYQVLAKR